MRKPTTAVILVLAAAPAAGQDWANDDALRGDAAQGAREVEQTLRDDLEQDPIFNVQGPAELAVVTLSGDRDRDFEQYRSLGNEVVLSVSLKQEGDRLVLDGWAFDLPSKQSILGKRFRGTPAQARRIAHYMADALHYQFSGRRGLSLTSIAFHSNRSAAHPRKPRAGE